jgi:hypothetical protein
MIQNHCVGTYIDRVDRGDCAIFHVDGYTLQVGIEFKTEKVKVMPETSIFGNGRITMPETKMVEVKTFKNLQFRGKHNKSAPQELVDEVQSYMDEFIKQDGFNKVKEGSEVYRPINSNRGTYINGIRLQVAMAQDEALPF